MMQPLMWVWQAWRNRIAPPGREVTMEGTGMKASWAAIAPGAMPGLRKTGREIRNRGPDRHARWKP